MGDEGGDDGIVVVVMVVVLEGDGGGSGCGPAKGCGGKRMSDIHKCKKFS